MKNKLTKLAILLILISDSSHSSNTPLSGTFSNAGKKHYEYVKPGLDTKINLIVTTNKNGQQFFIQCFKEEKIGFGVITEFKTPHVQAVINAGKYCPAIKLRIQLDYEEAYVRSGSDWLLLSRGGIYIPIVDH